MRLVSSFLFVLSYLWLNLQISQAFHEDLLTPDPGKASLDELNVLPSEDVDQGDHFHVLSKRAGFDTVAGGVSNGKDLMCMLRDVDVNGRLESLWSWKDFTKWYTEKPYGESGGVSFTGESMPTALDSLGLPKRTGDHGLKGFYYQQETPLLIKPGYGSY